MKHKGHLTIRVLIVVIITGVLAVAGTCGISWYYQNRLFYEAGEDAANITASMLSARFGAESRTIVGCAEAISRLDGIASSWVLNEDSVQAEMLGEYLCALLRTTPSIASIGVVFDRASFDVSSDDVIRTPFAVRSADIPIEIDARDGISADILADVKEMVWSEPIDIPGDTSVASAALLYPIENGVIICNILSGWVDDILRGTTLPFGGTYRLTAQDGREIYRTPGAGKDDAAFTASSAIASMGWKLEVSYPSSSEAENVTDPITMATIAGIIALVFGVCLAVILISPVRGSLLKLRRRLDTQRLEPGELLNVLDHTPPIAEISSLANSIGEMHDAMSKSVVAREQELLEKESERKDAEILISFREHLFSVSTADDDRYSAAARINASSELRGYFYEVQQTEVGTLFLAIGHVEVSSTPAIVSVPAAVSFLRSVLQNRPEPNTALAVMDKLLSKHVKDQKVSMLLAEFFPSTGTCAIASAGVHSASLIREKDGETAQIDLKAGALLGDGLGDYPSVIVNMSAGDAILMNSADISSGEPLSARSAKALRSLPTVKEALSSVELSGDGGIMLLRYQIKKESGAF